MVPAIGIPLERVGPDGGIQICGKYFKAGTVLGVNAWVVHRDQEVLSGGWGGGLKQMGIRGGRWSAYSLRLVLHSNLC